MKKILLACLGLLVFTTGCEWEEQDALKNQLKLKFEKDKDLQDYQISPDEMADCVAGKIMENIPGFPGSPKRKQYIVAYTKLVRVDPTEDFRPALQETAEVFGSVAKAHEAAGSITSSNFSCIGELVNSHPLKPDQE